LAKWATANSSTSKAAASTTSASAGTTSPSASTTRSPGTTSAARTWRSWPSRTSRATGAVSSRSAVTARSARTSWATPTEVLTTTTSKMTEASVRSLVATVSTRQKHQYQRVTQLQDDTPPPRRATVRLHRVGAIPRQPRRRLTAGKASLDVAIDPRHCAPLRSVPDDDPGHPMAVTVPCQRAMSTGQWLCWRTSWATLPSSSEDRSDRPQQPMMIKPAWNSLAALTSTLPTRR
jgi:hypothetical protein